MCSTFGSTDPKEDDENNNPKSADLKEVVNKLIPNSIGKDRKDSPVHLSSS